MDATETRISSHDRIGLGILALLLLSPIVFKVSVMGRVVIHPFVPVLALAWVWVAWTVRHTLLASRPGTWRMELQAVNLPMVLFAGTISALGLSLIINALRFGQFQSEGWLLLAKWVLYLAPLPLTALLAARAGRQTLRLMAWSIPLVALVTLGYSALRLQQSVTGSYYNTYFEQKGAFFAMGMFGEALSTQGLTVRLETASHGAYGMYLVVVLAFSVSLAMFRGWNGTVPSW